jgi:hypothetical protein
VSAMLSAALRALGMGASFREATTVANLLRESRDPEVRALLGPPLDDRQSWNRLLALAEETGAGGLRTLDLKTAYLNPNVFADLIARPPEGDQGEQEVEFDEPR